MSTLVILIVASAVVLAALCLSYGVAAHLGRRRARRAAVAAARRLQERYWDSLREMRRP